MSDVVCFSPGEPCGHNDSVRRLWGYVLRFDRELRPVRLMSGRNLVLAVTLIGAPLAGITAFAARWWLSQDFVPIRSYERDRAADAALSAAERAHVKDSLDALTRSIDRMLDQKRGEMRSPQRADSEVAGHVSTESLAARNSGAPVSP